MATDIMGKLTKKEEQVVMLRVFDNEGRDNVALVMNMMPDQVDQTLQSALQKLKRISAAKQLAQAYRKRQEELNGR